MTTFRCDLEIIRGVGEDAEIVQVSDAAIRIYPTDEGVCLDVWAEPLWASCALPAAEARELAQALIEVANHQAAAAAAIDRNDLA